MTVKDEKKQDDISLEEMLEEAELEQDNKQEEISTDQKRIQELELQLQEQKEITQKAQYNYINLKMDFDRVQKQIQEKEANLWVESLINSVKKFLPFVEDLRKSLDNITEDHAEDPLTKWVSLVYNNFLKTLESMKIFQIEAVWLVPDTNLHEAVSVQPIEDKKLKWKIISEFERWFIYKKDDIQKVITTSKVIVGQ